MANTLLFHSLLDSNKLIKSNFNSWYRKLKIILEYERILYMLTDPPLEESTTNAPRAMRDTYLKWLSDCTIMCCIIRAIMNDELSHKFKDV